METISNPDLLPCFINDFRAFKLRVSMLGQTSTESGLKGQMKGKHNQSSVNGIEVISMKEGIIIAIATIAVHFSTLALAQSTEEVPATEVTKPYEVVIKGRITKSRIRNLIIEVEDDWYQRFNELNTDDYYDVSCYEYIPIMSHIRKRVCEPEFMLEARSSNSSEVGYGLASGWKVGSNSKSTGAFLEHTKALRDEKHQEFDTLQEKMELFLDTDREFAEIGSVLTQLKNQLENYSKDD